MPVEFWFDPGCPFCWVTSRWINLVAPHRDLQVRWRPISLLFKNEPDPSSTNFTTLRRTTDLLRVVEALRAAGGEDDIGRLYTEFGRHIHNRHDIDFDVAAVLDELGLDPKLAGALDDPQWDEVIKESMDDGLSLAGDDVGTPIIAIEGPEGRVALFGPVITDLPELEESLELWDGLVKVMRTPGFFELKRARTTKPTPPPESTLDTLAG